MFLENEYQDWITRYECNTKAQETIFERLAFKKWEINKATKAGQNTKDLDKTYTDLLASINILPRQNADNGLDSSLTFGQLIEQWESTNQFQIQIQNLPMLIILENILKLGLKEV